MRSGPRKSLKEDRKKRISKMRVLRVELCPSSQLYMVYLQPSAPQNVALFGDGDLYRSNQVRVRSLGWSLIECN